VSTPATQSTYTVGPYRLIGQIGEGGMGVVYLAKAPDDSRVAVKVLRPYVVGDASGRARLAREVTSLRRVHSPRIAEVYDADPWGETPYVVTRYVPGPSLREVVEREGRVEGRRLTRLARGLAEALVVVHGADVLHRDVKPSNVLMHEGDPVLIDFGLAQLSDDVTLTQTGFLLGTPGYLAPEILYGDPPAPAADVHAWAATVVYAATGHGPYGSGPAMAVMDRARRGEANLTGVPAEMVAMLAAALRPDPAGRPTARKLLEWLDALEGREEATALTRVAPTHPPTSRLPVAPAPAPASAHPGAPTPAHPGADIAEPAVGRLRQAVFWTYLFLLVIAGTVAAPLVSALWLLGAAWGLRTLALATRAVRAWRVARGPRRGDATKALVLAPWFAARTLGATLANAASVAACAVGFVVLARFGPSQVETSSLVVAGVVAGLVAWGGPFSRDVRRGGRLVSSNLPWTGFTGAIVVVMLLALVSGLFAVQQIIGTTYLPFASR
jgi:hypothetical protein